MARPSQSSGGGQVQYTITPWRHPADLLRVRNNLYTPTTPQEQRRAIAEVAAWKLRGNVPHAVESTALLFDAMLFHARATNSVPGDENMPPLPSSSTSLAASSFALRAAYTTALSRFVTGFADLGRHKGGIGQSMFDVARTISLPPHFVELRHEVAHEEMPGLARLVRSAREAVGWLWGVYWGRLDEGGNGDGSSGLLSREIRGASGDDSGRRDLGLSTEQVRERARVVLREYRSHRVAKLKAGKGKKDKDAKAAVVCEECIGICHGENNRDRWEEVVGVLVDEGLIIPSLKQRGPLPDAALQVAYMLWDELLLKLAQNSDIFVEVFLEQAIAHNTAFKTTDSDQDFSDPAKWAVHRWIMHVLYSDVWRELSSQTEADWESVVSRECSLYPSDQWTKKLADDVAKHTKEGDDERSRSGTTASDTNSALAMEDVVPMQSGWRRAPGTWKRLPIGVVGG